MFKHTDRLPKSRRAVVVLVMLICALSVLGCSANASSGARIVMKDYQFAPQSLQARVGETVRVVIKNEDATAHTFTIQELGVNQNIPARQEAVIEFQPAVAGIYQYICLPHPNMVGAIEVKP